MPKRPRTIINCVLDPDLLVELNQAVAREAVKKKIRASRSGFMRRALEAYMKRYAA